MLPVYWSAIQEVDFAEVPTDGAEHELSLFMEDTGWPYSPSTTTSSAGTSSTTSRSRSTRREHRHRDHRRAGVLPERARHRPAARGDALAEDREPGDGAAPAHVGPRARDAPTGHVYVRLARVSATSGRASCCARASGRRCTEGRFARFWRHIVRYTDPLSDAKIFLVWAVDSAGRVRGGGERRTGRRRTERSTPCPPPPPPSTTDQPRPPARRRCRCGARPSSSASSPPPPSPPSPPPLHAAGVSLEVDGEMIPLAGFAQMTFLGAVLGGLHPRRAQPPQRRSRAAASSRSPSR